MADIFTEVEEGLREEKTRQLWERVWPFVAALAALIILGTAGRELWNYMNAREQATQATAFDAAVKALEDDDYQTAKDSLTAIVAEGGRFENLARHYLARTEIEGFGDRAAAEAALAGATGEDFFPRLSLLKAGYLRAETATVEELEDLLAPLLSGTDPLADMASELVATRAWQLGELELAKSRFENLQYDLNAPPGVQQRSAEAIAVIEAAQLDQGVTE